MNKKAMGLTFTAIIIAVLVLFVMSTLLYAYGGQISKYTKMTSKEAIKNKQEQCKLEGLRNPSLLKNDNDEYPNHCDICPWYDSSEDEDNDYMPKECDEDDLDSTKFQCLHGLDKRDQCKKAPVDEEQNREVKEKFDKAMEAFNKEDFDTAEKLFDEILKNYLGTDVYESAREKYYQILEIKSQKEELQRVGQMLSKEDQIRKIISAGAFISFEIEKGNFELAEKGINQLENMLPSPLDPEVGEELANFYFVMGNSFKAQGEIAKADLYYKKVFEEYPDSVNVNAARTAYSGV